MVTHIVLFKLADPSAENLTATHTKLMSMQGKIAQLRHLEAGVDVIRSEPGCTCRSAASRVGSGAACNHCGNAKHKDSAGEFIEHFDYSQAALTSVAQSIHGENSALESQQSTRVNEPGKCPPDPMSNGPSRPHRRPEVGWPSRTDSRKRCALFSARVVRKLLLHCRGISCSEPSGDGI